MGTQGTSGTWALAKTRVFVPVPGGTPTYPPTTLNLDCRNFGARECCVRNRPMEASCDTASRGSGTDTASRGPSHSPVVGAEGADPRPSLWVKLIDCYTYVTLFRPIGC
jgi:hypothetical protein